MQGSSLCSVLRHASQVQLGLQQMRVLLSIIHIKAAIFNSSGRYATNLLSITVIKFSGPAPSSSTADFCSNPAARGQRAEQSSPVTDAIRNLYFGAADFKSDR